MNVLFRFKINSENWTHFKFLIKIFFILFCLDAHESLEISKIATKCPYLSAHYRTCKNNNRFQNWCIQRNNLRKWYSITCNNSQFVGFKCWGWQSSAIALKMLYCHFGYRTILHTKWNNLWNVSINNRIQFINYYENK